MKSRVIDKDLDWKGILRAVGDVAKGSYVKVGILGDNERGGLHQVDPETGKASPLTVAEIAVVNEYGTEDGQIPARPAHRRAFDVNRDDLKRAALGLLYRVVIDRDLSVEQALGILGAKHAANIKGFIVGDGNGLAPNAPGTVEAKGSSRPLVDTARTINAISWAVVIGAATKAHKFLTGR